VTEVYFLSPIGRYRQEEIKRSKQDARDKARERNQNHSGASGNPCRLTEAQIHAGLLEVPGHAEECCGVWPEIDWAISWALTRICGS
jgi:hypothetical protein